MKLLEGDSAVGVSVAKDFGEEGTFFGEVSDADEGGTEDEGWQYHIIFDDGDEEDWDCEEYEEGVRLQKRLKKQKSKGKGEALTEEPIFNATNQKLLDSLTPGPPPLFTATDPPPPRRGKERERQRERRGGHNFFASSRERAPLSIPPPLFSFLFFACVCVCVLPLFFSLCPGGEGGA
jgi:hypothetical protein